ncbi:hypothetical protein AX14_007010 [Amanita brunnescens Koide BX004]|nr:hypothetical protein AX14_007010 [Amanita brunnescens Koide BX004]
MVEGYIYGKRSRGGSWLREMTFTYRHVPNPTDEQVEASVALFTDLMKDDVAVLSLAGGEPALIPDMIRATLKAGIFAAGEYYTASNEKGEMVGFTMWMPPGQEMFSTPEQRALGLDDFMSKLPEIGKEFYKKTYMARFPNFVNELLGPTGKVDSWWLHMAMVRRDSQRKGIATTLIDLVREKAAASGATIALSTTADANVPFYEGYGLDKKGHTTVPSPWGEWPIYVFALAPPTS